MKYAIDTEFIDTPQCSALISLAVVGEDGSELYFEFDYPNEQLTPWLVDNVIPSLTGIRTTDYAARKTLAAKLHRPEFWCFYGSYDWYWFCRVMGGMMGLPKEWPDRFREFADLQVEIPDIFGLKHNALNDAKSLMEAIKRFPV